MHQFRCLEQIRNDICYHELDVIIVGVGAGYSYHDAGYTHHGIEDIGVMRVLPHLSIYSPCDEYEAVSCAQLTSSQKGPAYVRLTKKSGSFVHQLPPLDISKPLLVKEGNDLTIVTHSSAMEFAFGC